MNYLILKQRQSKDDIGYRVVSTNDASCHFALYALDRTVLYQYRLGKGKASYYIISPSLPLIVGFVEEHHILDCRIARRTPEEESQESLQLKKEWANRRRFVNKLSHIRGKLTQMREYRETGTKELIVTDDELHYLLALLNDVAETAKKYAFREPEKILQDIQFLSDSDLHIFREKVEGDYQKEAKAQLDKTSVYDVKQIRE